MSGTILKESRYNKVLVNINVCLHFLLANVSIPLLLLLLPSFAVYKPQFFGLPMRRGISGSLRILQTFSATLGLLSYPASVLSSYWILSLSVSHSTKSSIGSISQENPAYCRFYDLNRPYSTKCVRFVYL